MLTLCLSLHCEHLQGDIQLLKTYGQGPYARSLKSIENEIKDVQKRVNEKMGVKESDTGLAPPNLWDLAADRQRMGEEHPLQVARCTKIIRAADEKKDGQENGAAAGPGAAAGGEGAGAGAGAGGGLAGALGGLRNALGGGAQPTAEEEDKYIINVKQIAKFVVGLGERVAPTDIEEGMRVGVDRNKYQIQIPLPPKIDPSVTMMQVEEKPDVTYGDVGGCKDQIEKLREVVETPLLNVSDSADAALNFTSCCGVLTHSQSHSRSDSSTSESTRQRAFYCTARQGQARHSAREPSRTGPTRHSSASSAPSWCKSTSAKARGWCESCSRWRAPRRRASSSLTKSTRSEARVSMTARVATTRCSGPCWSSSTSLTGEPGVVGGLKVLRYFC